jgi:hypothetical protein
MQKMEQQPMTTQALVHLVQGIPTRQDLVRERHPFPFVQFALQVMPGLSQIQARLLQLAVPFVLRAIMLQQVSHLAQLALWVPFPRLQANLLALEPTPAVQVRKQ